MKNWELIARLSEFPGDWEVYATRAGGSLELWDPEGPEYAYVFTYDQPTRRLMRRRKDSRPERVMREPEQ